MTPQEFAEKMREFKKLSNDDEETAHSQADALMCQVLEEVGYKKGVTSFRVMHKWYA
jgi:hypothetical protein